MDDKNHETKHRRLIFIIMDQEFKVYLGILTDYLKEFDCVAEIEFDEELQITSYGSNTPKFYCQGRGSHNFPIPIERMLEKYLDEQIPENDRYSPDGDGEYWEYRLYIDPKERTLKVFGKYTVYSSEFGAVWSSESEHDDELKKILDDLQKYLIEQGSTKVGNNRYHLNFSGGGDGGMLEGPGTFDNDITMEPNGEIEDYCYAVLENNYGGWEINEGSQGEFLFDIGDGTVECEFSWNTEDSAEELVFSKKY